MKDAFDRELRVGDVVAHAAAQRVYIRKGVVTEVRPDGETARIDVERYDGTLYSMLIKRGGSVVVLSPESELATNPAQAD